MLIAATGSARAQQVPDRADAVEIRRQFVSDLDTLYSKFSALATAIPADKYAWRPAPGVRSIGEVFMHVASEFYVWTPLSYGAPQSTVIVGQADSTMHRFESASTKADVLKHLKDGFAYTRATLTGIDPIKLAGTRTIFGGPHTIVESSFSMAGDLHEHLGQLIAYARMNGITPPWSK